VVGTRRLARHRADIGAYSTPGDSVSVDDDSIIPASRDGGRPMGCNPLVMSLRCLLVDDNVRFLEAARVLLDRQGLDVVGLASTGAEAIRLTQELRPDVALVDIDLGNESGFDLVRLISEQGGPAPSRLILISTHSEDDFADLIGQSPALGFLSKSELSAAAVEDLLKEHRGGRSPRF
jgi:DNA-binding NarL/FixJ family response regulator